MKNLKESEFGKGFAYCIGLFIAHAEREPMHAEKQITWFNGAGDHLYELQIPSNFTLKKECKEWQNQVIRMRLDYDAKDEDRQWAIAEAKRYLLQWDKDCGIDAIKGDYE